MKLRRPINIKQVLFIITIAVISFSCSKEQTRVVQENWGEVNNQSVYLYTLTNANGMTVKITNYGGIITSILVPDTQGNFEDVVLGFDNLQQYVDPNPCFGATIGRFANRIKNAEFTIDGETYQLNRNDGMHCIHGDGEFNKVVWNSKIIENSLGSGIELNYLSKDGTKGFPGNLKNKVTYTLTDDNAIHVHFEATTDKATHVSMTQHSYFNLSACKDLIYDHLIKIDADQYTEIDSSIVPTGKLGSVIGTDWDLTQMTPMGENIHKLNHNGYHFNYVFNKPVGELAKVIEVIEPESGRTLEVSTTQPGVQFYSGNAISDEFTGKYGIQYKPHIAFCLETQHFPATPNYENFPSSLLKPGEKYEEVVIYKFGVINK